MSDAGEPSGARPSLAVLDLASSLASADSPRQSSPHGGVEVTMGDAAVVRTPAWGPQGVAEAAIEAGARALWGARAIDRRGRLDLPPDRHEATGERSLLRGVRIADVLASVERAYRDLGEEPRLVLREGDRQITARRAGGYVYVLVAVY